MTFPNPSHAVRRLRLMALHSAPFRHWYTDANTQILCACSVLPCSPRMLADLLAIFSPRTSVTRSIRVTLLYLTLNELPRDTIRTTRAALLHYQSTGEIRGPKTAPFAANLAGNPLPITLDTWMARIFSLNPSHIHYPRIARPYTHAINRVATRLGWTPASVQACVWATIRSDYGRTNGPYPLLSTLHTDYNIGSPNG